MVSWGEGGDITMIFARLYNGDRNGATLKSYQARARYREQSVGKTRYKSRGTFTIRYGICREESDLTVFNWMAVRRGFCETNDDGILCFVFSFLSFFENLEKAKKRIF